MLPAENVQQHITAVKWRDSMKCYCCSHLYSHCYSGS